jgi:hypothetical protein
MPTTKRSRRHARGTGGRGLSDCQRDLLCDGQSFFAPNDPGFASEAEAARAWKRHRGDLMAAESGAGKRPVGYLRYELGIEDAEFLPWPGVIAELLSRDLIPESEAIAIESAHAILDPHQSESFNSAFAADRIHLTQFSPDGLRGTAAEFAFAVRWHTWRAHAELAMKYSDLAASIRSFVENATS